MDTEGQARSRQKAGREASTEGVATSLAVMRQELKGVYGIFDLPAFFEFKERRIDLTWVLWFGTSSRGPGKKCSDRILHLVLIFKA
ncbi:MAG: hypothetical protein NPIRA03_18680 [Nitrospirales bacterium]|nr:MAG: hypothetical protein NPIRA03_18680 [Nitrospirales bacterium]